MNKILRSSSDFEKNSDQSTLNNLDPNTGLTERKNKFPPPKGLIIPDFLKDSDPLIESTELELPPEDIIIDDEEVSQEDEDLAFYRATCQLVGQFMTDPATLNMEQLAQTAYNIMTRVKAGSNLLRLAMRPTYIEPFISAHPVNMAILVTLFCQALRYDEPRCIRAIVAALIHDIGMARLDPEILQHQRELSPEEKQELRRHPIYGAALINEYLGEGYQWLATVALQEHERAQGQGYPEGLVLEAIDPVAQIVGLLDVYEAFTHPRRQHAASSPSRIVRQIIESRDQLFSPTMIKALLQAVSVYPIETYVLLNNGQIGRVIATDPRNPLRPVLELLTDHNRKPLVETREINLGKNPVISIVRALEMDETHELHLSEKRA